MIRRQSLGYNASWSLAAQALPMLTGVLALPVLVRSLGIERFGLLTTAWLVLAYFASVDLGIGRAAMHFGAQALGHGAGEELPTLLATSMILLAVVGSVVGFLWWAVVPLLVERILRIPTPLRAEAHGMLMVIGGMVPAVLMSGSATGLLEAQRRFDVVGSLRMVMGVLTFAIPWWGGRAAWDLATIMWGMLLSRWLALGVFMVVNLRLFRPHHLPTFSLPTARRLIRFGSWITVSSVLGPLLVYLDRMLVAALRSLEELAYYSAPSDTVTRLWIIPVSLCAALYPLLSAGIQARDGSSEELLRRSFRYLLLTMGPVLLVIVVFAEPLLRAWLGAEFAPGALPVQLLAAGMLVNSLANLPHTLLQVLGRPDIPAKLHLLEVPFHLAAAIVLTRRWGIAGAALSWSLRVTVDAVLLFVASQKLGDSPWQGLWDQRLMKDLVALALLGAAFLTTRIVLAWLSLPMQLLLVAAEGACFLGWVWARGLDDWDRDTLLLKAD